MTRTIFTIESPKEPCRFCGRLFDDHNDPPTQQICETSCLGSKCNFKPVSRDSEESLAAISAFRLENEATVALLRWASCGTREVYLTDWSGLDEYVARRAGLEVARAASAIGLAYALGLVPEGGRHET